MSDSKAKGFFERPEGKTGAFFMVALGAAGLYGLYLILPFLITLVTNLLYLGLLCAGAAAVVFLFADPRFRTLLWYFYKSAMRAVTGAFIVIDPIGILKGYVEDLRDKQEDMNKHRAKLEGEKRKLKILIDDNERQRQHSLGIAKQAHSKGAEAKTAFVLQARQAGRLEKSNMTLQALLNKMETMGRVLKKMQESSDFMLQDIESEVEVRTAERAAIQASYGAFTAARNIIEGDGDKREMYDMATEHLANDYAMKVGEIELFMDMSKGFIQSVDLENGVYEQDALDQFEAWEKKADQLILGETPTARVAGIDPSKLRVDATAPIPPEALEESSFDDLYNSKGQ